MNRRQVLRYEDLIWRVREVAAENQALLEDTAVSLPAPVIDQSRPESGRAGLLAFLYTLRDEDDNPENPEIFHPYARVRLRPDGEVIEWALLGQPRRLSSAAGLRFAGLAADMEPDEREAFIETYYELLTSDEGPLWRSWPGVRTAAVRDLRELFYALVEEPFLPLYRQHASEFLKLIGTPP